MFGGGAMSQVPMPQGQRRHLSDKRVTQIFVIPTIVLLIVMNVFPLIYSLYLSFTEYSVIKNEPPKWVGLDNYTSILNDSRFWENFAFTGKYALISVTLQMVIGFTLAMLLREKFKGSGLLTTLILIPMMLSPVVVGKFWANVFNPSFGFFNYLFGYSNPQTAPSWTGDPDLAMWAVIIVDVWMWSPFVMLLSLAGLSAIPEYLYEAAAIDRASPWFQFRRITLPQVMPLLLIAVLFRTIEALKQFDLVMGLTGGGPSLLQGTEAINVTETVSVRLYRVGIEQHLTGSSSALAYIMLVVIIAISNLYIRALNQAREG
jgi:multiple sugar transport system permease protein